MIKNIIFDIGSVILNFDYKKIINEFTEDIEEQKFIMDYIVNSPEWMGYGLIDTGFVTREEVIKLIQDRTNHEKDSLIENFWNTYINYAFIDENVVRLIEELKDKEYKIYLLSNINDYTVDKIKGSKLFDIVDGYILSYVEHQIKPYKAIYKTLLDRYGLKADECAFLDDNENNIKTANELGILGKKVEPNSYKSILKAVNEII